MRVNYVLLLWFFVTVFFTLTLIFAMLSPAWFENTNVTTNAEEPVNLTTSKVFCFGIIKFCQLNVSSENCKFYQSFQEIPSLTWIFSASIYAIGVLFFIVTILLSLLLICMSKETREKIKIAISYFQGAGVFFLVISNLIFPMSIDSKFARTVCGQDAGKFRVDQCELAWGYMLSIVTSFLTIFCPILAKYSSNASEYTESEDPLMDFEYKGECISLKTNSSSKVMTTV